MKTESIGAKAAWVAHDNIITEEITRTHGHSKLEMINSYYGSKIALYFGWLEFYTVCLQTPAIAGTLLFVHQYFIDSVDSSCVPVFCMGMCLWGTYFLEFWKRRGTELSFAWKTLGVEDDEADRELAEAAGKESSATAGRQLLSLTATLSIMFVLVRLMLFYIHAAAHAEEHYGSASYMQYYPTVVYSVLPLIATAVFDPISALLNDFEKHATQAEADNSLIYKKFALQFVNRYSALLYTAFWLKDMEQLRALLISLLTTGALVNNAIELGIPYLSLLYGRYTSEADKGESDEVAEGESLDTTLNQPIGEKKALSDEEKAKAKSLAIRPAEDYLEMLIQYGYISMFAVAFPLAPLLAYVNNYFEGSVDIAKLAECRRSPIEVRSTIGAWQSCLEIISFVSVLTNCFLLVAVSTQLGLLLPGELKALLNAENGQFLAMLVIEHFLVAVKLVMMNLIDDTPRWVKEALAAEKNDDKSSKQKRRVNEFIQRSKDITRDVHIMEATDDVNNEFGDGAHMGSQSRSGVPHIPHVDPATHSKNIAVARLVSQSNTQFGFDPLNVTVLSALPPLLHFLNVSAWLYIPAAVGFFSYYQAQKDRADRKAAIGIVSDPALMRLVLEEMPSWVTDSSFQRVEWINSILQKLWPKIVNATEDVVKAALQPLLNDNTPMFLSSLTLSRFHLGTISPKLIGVRFYSTEESSVRLDVELRWAGDPVISLKVGAPVPVTIEVAELRISAVLRIELLDLKSAFPCFKTISVTCMKKPVVDFSLKLASVDLMNLGASDYNVSRLVRTIIHDLITTACLYPKKIIIPMEPEGANALDENMIPEGLLTLTVVRGINIKQANIFGSDPYVEIRPQTIGDVVRTTTKTHTLTPHWDETFHIVIFDKATQWIELSVFDYDMTQMDKHLGKATLELAKLINYAKETRILRLLGGGKGELEVSCHYLPLGTKNGKNNVSERSRAESADILFDLRKSELTNDILVEDDVIQAQDVRRDSSTPSNQTANGAHKNGKPNIAALQRGMSFRQPDAQGVLQVSHMRVEGLKAPTFLYMNDTSFRPFLTCAVGDTTKTTKYQKGVREPSFVESFSFVIRDTKHEMLVVSVWDRNKWTSNRLVGTVELAVSDVIANSHGVWEQKHMLEGGNQEYVYLKLVWLSATK
eukprot:gene25395-31853_t